MDWWVYLAYNLETGNRAVISICNGPMVPCIPYFFNPRIKTKWVRAEKVIRGTSLLITSTKATVELTLGASE